MLPKGGLKGGLRGGLKGGLKGGLRGGLKAGEFENAGFSFFLEEKHFENEAFRRQCSHENDVISMLELDR